jgi:hypothetical protein
VVKLRKGNLLIKNLPRPQPEPANQQLAPTNFLTNIHGSNAREVNSVSLMGSSQAGVETLDERVLGRLAGRDVVPLDLPLLAEAQHGAFRLARVRCPTCTSPVDRARR